MMNRASARSMGMGVVLSLLCIASSISLIAQPNPPNDRVEVIIGFNQQPGASEQALVRAFGGAIKHTYRIIPAIAATLPQRAIQALENHPLVSVIEPDVRLYALGEYSTAWGVSKIGAQTVHLGGNTGIGVAVCVIDSGIDTNHPDLYANYVGGYDFVNNDADPSDDNGHGTHVAGSIAAMLNGSGVVGVAPDAKIFAYKILDASGSGSFSNAIKALEKCQQDALNFGATGIITNNSYGSSGDPGTLVKTAFDNTYRAGLLHVAASGNAAWPFPTCSSVSYPAKYDSVIAVGATDTGDKIASWSCKGAEVELAAPGVNITSTYPNDTYATGSGTSMASPHVAGTAALVFKSQLPDLNGDGYYNNIDVRLCMQQTALDLGTAGRDTSYGFGRVQADQAAMNCKAPSTGPPAAPSNLRVTGVGKNYVKLAWNDNSNNETNFVVERCTGSGCSSFTEVASLSANTTSYNNTGLARRTPYTFRVKAVNSGGSSGYSNTATGTTK